MALSSNGFFCLLLALVSVELSVSQSQDVTPPSKPQEDVTPENRIFGGREVVPHSKPYMVALAVQNSQFCGGSIIDANTVLTAAHCLENLYPSQIQVHAGRHYRTNTQERSAQIRNVRAIRMHPFYNARIPMENDIAILKVAPPFDIKVPEVSPVELPPKGYVPRGKIEAIGWGLVGRNGPSARLLSVKINVISDQECSRRYGENLPDHSLCASEKGKSSCQGDSGGPWICDNKYLCGITSWGEATCVLGQPSVNMEVSHFLPWIQRNRG